MDIIKNFEDGILTLNLIGRLDTTTSPLLENEVKELTEDVKELVFDLDKLDYISSAGLRVFLSAQKIINGFENKMIVKNVKDEVLEVFEITGFTDILNIEKEK